MNQVLLSFLAQAVAIAACCVGGAMGGYALARPLDALEQMALRPAEGDGARGVAEARAFGGLLLAAHGGVAATLGYAPYLGAVMAATLALVWLGSAGGRGLSLALDRTPGVAGAATAARNLLILDLLMGAGLLMPLWILYGSRGAATV